MSASRSRALGRAAAALCILAAGDAQAYLDPGTGSVIFQAVAAAIAGTALALRIYWRKIKSLFSSSQIRSEAPEAVPDQREQGSDDRSGRS